MVKLVRDARHTGPKREHALLQNAHLRLFSGGSDAKLTEWDLTTLVAKVRVVPLLHSGTP